MFEFLDKTRFVLSFNVSLEELNMLLNVVEHTGYVYKWLKKNYLLIMQTIIPTIKLFIDHYLFYSPLSSTGPYYSTIISL